jgi:hypothetical protein
MEVGNYHISRPDFFSAFSDQVKPVRTCLRLLNRFFAFLILYIYGVGHLAAQDSLLLQPITLVDTTCTLEAALKLIERNTGLSFSYNSGLINKKKLVTLKDDQHELLQVLRQIIDNPLINYSIIGRHIVVYLSQKVLSANPDTHADSVYFFEIRGRVLDKASRDPLPYSSIYLTGKSVGTVTNDNGQFQLRLNSKYLTDTLSVSCIGYRDFKTSVASQINADHDFLLKPDVISIQEVIIRKINPVNLLQSATEAVSMNYPRKPAILTSFYRELIKKGNRYMMVSEAILENYKSGYQQFALPDQVKILKGRKSIDSSAKDSVMLKLKAGLNTMLLLDVVKNMPDFMTGENLQYYDYKMADIVVDRGRDQYAIEFRPKMKSVDTYYSGRILLDVRNLAFTWVEFYVDPEKLDLATDKFILKKPPYLKVKVLKANYKIGFREMGNKYYLHLVQCEMGFRIKDKRQLTGSVYNTNLEMAVTDIDTLNAGRFRMRETARLNEFFTDQLREYDESFWGEYNFISPDESLEDALVKLSKVKAEGRD